MQKNPLFVLDGHGTIFRSYFAHIRQPLRNSKNENTSAIFGFFQAVKKIFDEYGPKEFCIVFDHDKPSFRKKMYPAYKATRQKTPEDLTSQIPIIFDIVRAMGIPLVIAKDVEADDAIATLAALRDAQKKPTRIISSDKDIFQMLSDYTHIFRPASKQVEWTSVTPQWLKAEWQLEPAQVRDYLALIGDASDNVPGVAGVGEKTALALLHEYGSLEGIYKNIDAIKPAWQKKLVDDEKNARISYELVALKTDVPIAQESFEYPAPNWAAARELFEEHEIYSFARKAASGAAAGSASTSSGRAANKNATAKSAPDAPNAAPHATPARAPKNPDHAKRGVYHRVTGLAQIDKIVKRALSQKYIAIDLETDSLSVFQARIAGIALSVTSGEGFYIPLRMCESDRAEARKNGRALEEREVLKSLAPLFADGACMLILHNSKFDIPILARHGLAKNLRAPRSFFDTLVAAWMCDVTLHSYAMDNAAKHFLSYEPISFSSLRAFDAGPKETKPPSDFALVPLAQAVDYAAEDADVTLRLYEALLPQLRAEGMEALFFDLEMPITEVLMRMEGRGIMVDTAYFKKLSVELQRMQEILKQEIYALCGKEFNIGSTKQLQEVLFKDLLLPTKKKNKTGFSTDVAVLSELAYLHEAPGKILEYRHVTKLQNTYADTLPLQIEKSTGRIHTSFHQNGTETGRISSMDPNLQNIPVKDELGQKIRRAFIAPKGSVFVGADYSQIELVVLAHLSQDANLMRAFRDGADIHRRTASILMRVAESEVDDKMRRIAKSINFGIIYGMSAFRLSNELRIAQKDAKQFIDDYFAEFKGVADFIARTERETEESGYASTLLGRRRGIPTITSRNKNLQNAAKRMAVNTVIQGSAADIVKCAMLAVDEALRTAGLQSALVLQIHDELVLECPASEREKVEQLLPEAMKNAYKLSVPVNVSVRSGTDWSALK